MPESDEPIRDETPNHQPNHAGQAGSLPHEDVLDPDGRIEHPSIHYEDRDVTFRWVLIVAIVGVCVGAALFGLVYAFFRADTDRLASRRESEFPLAEHPSEVPPPEPRLEQIDRLAGIARENIFLRESAKENQLDSYGETQEQGFVHIPIGRALESLAGHLPVRKEPPPGPSKDNGLVDSGASNSGRMLRGAPR
jgi:hypothetical protein